MVTKERERAVTLGAMLVVLVIALTYTAYTVLKVKQAERADNPAAHAFSNKEGQTPYTDLQGNAVTLDTYVGDVIVANSWASWSPKSATELPRLVSIADEFREEGIVIIAVNRAEPGSTAERFLRSIGVSGDVKLVLDPDDRYYESIEGYAMPETLIYDRQGQVVFHQHGSISTEVLRANIRRAIEAE